MYAPYKQKLKAYVPYEQNKSLNFLLLQNNDQTTTCLIDLTKRNQTTVSIILIITWEVFDCVYKKSLIKLENLIVTEIKYVTYYRHHQGTASSGNVGYYYYFFYLRTKTECVKILFLKPLVKYFNENCS